MYHLVPVQRPMGDDGSPWSRHPALVVGALLGAAYLLLRKEKKSARRKGGAGWYVELYNHPPGHVDRRNKGTIGPFMTREEAQSEAAAESDVWYTKVKRRAR